MRLSTSFLFLASVSAFVPHSQTRIHAPFLRSSGALSMADEDFDFDVAVIGCGVGGHGAALHSRAQDGAIHNRCHSSRCLLVSQYCPDNSTQSSRPCTYRRYTSSKLPYIVDASPQYTYILCGHTLTIPDADHPT